MGQKTFGFGKLARKADSLYAVFCALFYANQIACANPPPPPKKKAQRVSFGGKRYEAWKEKNMGVGRGGTGGGTRSDRRWKELPDWFFHPRRNVGTTGA